MIIPSVPASAEFKRIAALPRREYSGTELEEIVRDLSRALRTPTGSGTLLPPQAVSILELLQYGRLLCPMKPGAGKTLVSLVAGYALEAQRPLLIVPGKLVEPTKRAIVRYGKDWRVAWWIRVVSYQQLARISHEKFLEEYDPDLILCDEAHKLKNKRAGVTKRIKFFLQGKGKGRCRFVPLSGTFSDRNPENYSHLAWWALGDMSPLPHTDADLKVWVQAIGENLQGPRARPGALLQWVDREQAKAAENDPDERLKLIREGFARRVKDTPGVIATESPLPAISLTITRHELPSDPAIEDAFRILKKWETPDGFPLTKGLHVAMTARQLKKGFFYIWEPRPPRDWIACRKEWSRLVRKVLVYSRTWVTELQVANACRAGEFERPEWVEWCKFHQLDHKAWQRWQAIKHTYEGTKRGVWISTLPLDYAALWLNEPGIVWTEHTEFGEELSRRTGAPYHGAAGLCARDGVHIEQRKRGTPVISGMGSSEGLNLQHNWHRNLIADPMKLGRAWEQLLARTHRNQQPEDEVIADVLAGCRYDEEAWEQALRDAEYLTRTDQIQRLVVADKLWDSPGLSTLWRLGHRWRDLSKED